MNEFHDDDVIHTKIMAILLTSTSGISNVFYQETINVMVMVSWFYRNLQEKETVVLKRIDQLPQNFPRVHNLVGSFDRNHKNVKFFILPIVFIVFYCLSIVRRLFQT